MNQQHPSPKGMQCQAIYHSLAQKGYTINQQRKVLIEALCEQRHISNLEDFWISLRSQYRISWSTVYTNLRLLIQMGWVLKEEQDDLRTTSYTLIEQNKTNINS